MSNNRKILEVKNLVVSFKTFSGKVQAARGVNFYLNEGETLAIVGESGSGKTVASLMLLRLIQSSQMKVENGEILFYGRDLLTLSEKEMQNIRGKDIAMIFQDPMVSLNPTMRIGNQIMEGLIKHKKLSTDEAKRKVIELLILVGIPNPEERFKQYPFEFSGGMRQRAMIAMAIAMEPKLLIADEPTTALDVITQAQILEIIKNLQRTLKTSVIFITHNLGVVANVADRVAVMYAGQVIEVGTLDEIFYNPQHPYTWGLLASMPDMQIGKNQKLVAIPGSPPDLTNPPKGDAFAVRSKYAMKIDYETPPPIFQVSDTHFVSSWLLHPNAPAVNPPEIIKQRYKNFNSL